MQIKSEQFVEFVTQSIFFGEITQRSEAMDSHIWDRYLKFGCRIFFNRGEYIYRIGENVQGLFFIKKGKVKGSLLSKDGTVKTIFIKEDHTIFGEQFIFHHQPGIVEVIALDNSELYFFPKNRILNFMQKDFNLTLFICQTMSIQSRMMAHQIQDLSSRNVLQSLARIIYCMFCSEKTKSIHCLPMEINITHEELANMLGVHRVTVTKNLNYIKRLGIIDHKYEKIMILDPENLIKLTE